MIVSDWCAAGLFNAASSIPRLLLSKASSAAAARETERFHADNGALRQVMDSDQQKKGPHMRSPPFTLRRANY
jgi:hypothetical protein